MQCSYGQSSDIKHIYMSNIINIGKKEKRGLKWFTAGEEENAVLFVGLTGYVQDLILFKWPLHIPTFYRAESLVRF